MPTESTFFFAGLLFLAAGLGYIFARFGDFDDEEKQEAESARFLKGFRYLLNEEPDRAVEAFTSSGEINDDVLDTQLALGALFRKRGELERAIRIHQNIVERPGLSQAQRDRVIFALADDFFGAGLFDRAEEMLHRLRDSAPYKTDALRRLLRICEVTRDWQKAVDLGTELQRLDPTAVTPVQLANYHCELAEQARREGRAPEARRYLNEAIAIEPYSVRARLVAIDLLLDEGRPGEALEESKRLATDEPTLIPEVIPRLASAGVATHRTAELSPLLATLGLASPEATAATACAVVRTPSIQEPGALEVLGRWVDTDPLLSELAGSAATGATGPSSGARLAQIRAALHRLARSQPAYLCRSCGYHSASLQWQCPGCRSWETIRGATRLLPGG